MIIKANQPRVAARFQLSPGLRLVLFGLAVAGVMAIFGYSGWCQLNSEVVSGSAAPEITIQIEGPLADEDPFVFSYSSPGRKTKTLPFDENEFFAPRPGASLQWRIHHRFVKRIHLSAPEEMMDRIRNVRVTVGDHVMNFQSSDLTRKWTRVGSMAWFFPMGYRIVTLEMPAPARAAANPSGILNWISRDLIAWYVIIRPMLLTFLALAVVLILRSVMKSSRFRECSFRALTGAESEQPPGRPYWFAAGLLICIAVLIVFEYQHPYRFTDDDNVSQFLPVIVQAGRSVLSGQIPTWNPYQLLGSPTMTVGTYMLTYPPLYISYFIARFLLANEFTTIEVFVILHLLLGYVCTYWMLRRVGVRDVLACAGCCCFILCGWFMIAGRSQFTLVPIAIFLPLMIGLLTGLERRPTMWKWAVAMGCVLGAFFHAGHAQMWVYMLLFYGLAVVILYATRRICTLRLGWCLVALGVGSMIAAPLAVLQYQETRGIERLVLEGPSASRAFLQMVLPLGKLGYYRELGGTFDYEYNGQLFYSGTVFTVLTFFGLLFLMSTLLFGQRRTVWRIALGENVWLVCATSALILSLGAPGILWELLSLLPPFDKFRWPIKFIPFFVLFSVVAGGSILERLLRLTRSRLAPALTSLLAITLSVFGAGLARSSFYSFGIVPYPKFPSELVQMLHAAPADRFLSVVPIRSTDNAYANSLPLNMATLAGVFSFSGYDTFVAASQPNLDANLRFQRDPISAASAYGLRYLVYSKLAYHPKYSKNPLMWLVEDVGPLSIRIPMQTLSTLRDLGRPVIENRDMTVYRLPSADPLAFSIAKPDYALPIGFDSSGATVDTASVKAGERLIVNVLWRPWIRTSTSQGPVRAESDDWGRVAVVLPTPAAHLRLRYAPPWRFGISIAAGFGVGTFLLGRCLSGWLPSRVRMALKTVPGGLN